MKCLLKKIFSWIGAIFLSSGLSFFTGFAVFWLAAIVASLFGIEIIDDGGWVVSISEQQIAYMFFFWLLPTVVSFFVYLWIWRPNNKAS